MIGKLKEILFFMFIFSLVSQGLSILAISPTNYGGDDLSGDYYTANASFVVLIEAVVASILSGFALSVVIMGSGSNMSGDKIASYGLLTGMLTMTLISVTKMLWNIFYSIPLEAQPAMGIFLVIFFGVLGMVVVWAFIDMAQGRNDEI